MHNMILWILALYGLVAVWIQFRKWWYFSPKKGVTHYYIYTFNSQATIEWAIRSIARLAQIEGRPYYIHVIDSGSEDDTLKIVERMIDNGVKVYKHQIRSE